MNKENNTPPINTPQDAKVAEVPKKSSSSWIYWLIGVCGCILILAIIVPIVLGYGFFNFAKKQAHNFNPDHAFDNLEDKFGDKFYDEFEKNLEDELSKLEKEFEDLEEDLKDKTKDKKETKPEDAQTEEAVLQVATIEGNLSYPSEQIPDLTVCAEDIFGASSPYCTTSLIDDPKYTAGRGYQLEVPPGDYYVYTYFGTTDYLAYYTDFVPCGMDVSCPSHDYIIVTVADGDHLTNIDPTDWYMP